MAYKTPSKAAIEACKEYMAAVNSVIKITPIVLAIQEEILSELDVRFEDGTKVDDIRKLYLVDDETANTVYEALHRAYASCGYELPEVGYCPLLMAEDRVRKAARKMNELMEEFIPNGQGFTEKALCKSLDLYNRLTDMNYSYLIQFAN